MYDVMSIENSYDRLDNATLAGQYAKYRSLSAKSAGT